MHAQWSRPHRADQCQSDHELKAVVHLVSHIFRSSSKSKQAMCANSSLALRLHYTWWFNTWMWAQHLDEYIAFGWMELKSGWTSGTSTFELHLVDSFKIMQKKSETVVIHLERSKSQIFEPGWVGMLREIQSFSIKVKLGYRFRTVCWQQNSLRKMTMCTMSRLQVVVNQVDTSGEKKKLCIMNAPSVKCTVVVYWLQCCASLLIQKCWEQ